MLAIPAGETVDQIEADCGALAPDVQMRNVLAALEKVEARYRSDRTWLEERPGPDVVRKRLLDLLEARHARERLPLVQQLAELHRRIMTASMFQGVHLTH